MIDLWSYGVDAVNVPCATETQRALTRETSLERVLRMRLGSLPDGSACTAAVRVPVRTLFLRACTLSLILALLSWNISSANPVEHSIPGGGTFDPFLAALQPELRLSPLPAWMEKPAIVNTAEGWLEIPIEPRWRQPAVTHYVVTIVFDDPGDGGPLVHWRDAATSAESVVSESLATPAAASGLNSRTLLIPQALSDAGGTLLVRARHTPSSLLSVAVRPARDAATVAIGDRRAPSLIDPLLQVLEDREVNGTAPIPLGGDLRDGSIVEAELAPDPQPLDEELEFEVPIRGSVEGAYLHSEIIGLNPEASIEIDVNGQSTGHLDFAPFALDDPSIVTDWNGRLHLAGWRKGSLFLPARFLKEGPNSIVLRLLRPEGDTGRPVLARNTLLHLRFAPSAFNPPPPEQTQPSQEEESAPDFSSLDPVLPE